MRTLQVGRAEKVTDVLDRLQPLAGIGGEVEILVPSDALVARTKVDLELIARGAGEMGLTLHLVSDDPAVVRGAAEAGMKAELDTPTPHRPAGRGSVVGWTPPAELALGGWATRLREVLGERLPAIPDLPRLPGRVVLVIAALAGMCMVLVAPSAHVTLTARPVAVSSPTVQIQGGKDDELQVRLITVSSQQSGSYPVTGSQSTGATPAQGQVTYHDECHGSGDIPSGTLLHTADGTTFVQLDDVRIKRHHDSDVTVRAQAPGAAGDVGANQITRADLPSDLSGCVTVTNSSPTTGGSDGQTHPVVAQGDLDQARTQLTEQLHDQVLANLQQQAGTSEKPSDRLIVQSSTFTSNVPVGGQATQLTATLAETIQAAYYSRPVVENALRQSLLKAAGPAQVLVPGSVQVQYQVTDLQPNGQLTLQGHATGMATPRLDYERIRSHLAGRSMGEAADYLRTLPVSTAHISRGPLSPLPVLPWFGFRIQVDYHPT